MDGLRFTTLNETPCAEPHAGCCGDWGLDTPGYPIESFCSEFGAGPAGRALDLGCGPADIVCRLARHYPQLHFNAVDGAAVMLEWAEANLSRYGTAAQVSLLQRHLPCNDLPVSRYQVIISNSLLHHMRDAADFWAMVADYADVGCRVMVMDLARPASEVDARQLVARYAADAPEVLRQDFHNSLLAAYRPDEVRSQLQAAGLAGLAVQMVSDRHWLVSGRLD